jgi:6-pyruvoyltetrahydropterin/6-carboxytetrahydropterin synthase
LLRVSRVFEWDAAHRLPDHKGPCRNIHGHRYKAEIWFESPDVLAPDGMVIDFGIVKDIVGFWINKRWDHACLLSTHDQHPVAEAIRETLDMRVFLFDWPPTVEIITSYLAKQAASLLRDLLPAKYPPVEVVKVRVWETPNCSAEWTRGS